MSEPKSTLAQIRQQRIDKANNLKKLGIDPYPSKTNRTHTNKQIVDDFGKHNDKKVIVVGRIMSWREHGKLIFAHIQDPSGRIQLYIKAEDIEETNIKNQTLGFEDSQKYLDIGDIVEAEGIVTKTQRGEISIIPKKLRLLTKAIRPLPEKWKGLQDKEALFRQRYLDTIMNPEKKWRFEIGAKITFAIREFLNGKGFLEIKTPIIQPVYGGTSAKPFKTHINALNQDYYLAVSHELYLKRLITAGFENVYNLVGYFRNEGIDRTHNPEFSMIETMTAYQNYEYNMDLTEEMYRYIAEKVFGKYVFKIRGEDVDFSKKWERIKMIDAVKKYANIDFNEIKTLEKAHKTLEEIGYKEQKPETIGECMVIVFEEKVEEKLIQPTFVYGHPVEISPLAKSMPEDPRFVERFEIFMAGIEGGDNWTELNDPIELYDRFKEQVKKGRGGEEEFHPMDIDFIECMEYGMAPTTGLGPGIERLIMMFTETDYIDDVIFFPMQRPAPISNLQKEIYEEEYLVAPEETNKNQQKQDKTKKAVIILNKELEGWQLTNTISHLSAYLGNQIGNNFSSRPSFVSKDGIEFPANSQYPFISMSASGNQLQNLFTKIKKTDLKYLVYTQDMIDLGDDIELQKNYEKKNFEELDIIGIGVFGKNEEIDKLTKKFSLWK